MSYLEVSPAGIEKIKEMGIEVSEADECIPSADIVILAIPDVALESVSASVIPAMKEEPWLSPSILQQPWPENFIPGKTFHIS